MSQQLPGGFPNVQRLQQFAGTNQYGQQYGQGPMAAPFQGGPPRPQLAGAYPPPVPPVLRAPGPPAPWMINPAATPAMAQAKANWQNGPAGGAAPITNFYANGGGVPVRPVYNPAASPAAAIAKTTSPFVPTAPPPVFRPVAPAPPPTAAMAAPQAAPAVFPPVSAPPTYTPGQAPAVPYAPFGARLSDRREKRVLSLKDILGS